MLTSFQFTQSALPTRLAALFPCDYCWPIAAQAHLVPCEAGASLHYITAATGCHGNTHGHYHTVLVCVWNMTLCVFVSVLNVYRHRVPTGLENHWKFVGLKKKQGLRKNTKLCDVDCMVMAAAFKWRISAGFLDLTKMTNEFSLMCNFDPCHVIKTWWFWVLEFN